MPDLHSAPAHYADEETVDTDFVHHLVRGAELLQTGDPSQARGMLERALRLRPKNERGQNLLALSYFKLGLYDRAEEIYRALISEHPADAALRVNLGLVQIKTAKTEEAVVTLTIALDLAPNHAKAQNYLGLAYLQKKDFTRARECFDKAGNLPMRERASQGLAVSPLQGVGETALMMLETREAPFSAAESTPLRAPGAWIATRPAVRPDVAQATAAAPDLASFSAANRIETVVAAPFAITPTMVVIDVRTEVFARVEGLVAAFGQLDIKTEYKRFRGRVTDKSFGEPGRRMMRVAGVGRLWISPGGRQFHAVEIGDEPAYFREEALYAFEESLLFENGRVPSRYGSDLHLVHLRNRGRALLVSKNHPRSVDVVKGEPCRVPLDVLLGWHGNVAPRIVAIVEDASAEGLALAAVELTGEGRVLLDAPL